MKTLSLNNSKVTPLSDQFRTDQVSRLCGNWGHRRLARISVPLDTYTVHQGFLDYLSLAYRKHYSIVIRPDDIWFMIMAELTLVVAKNPKDYAHLFTTTSDKRQTILVPTNDPTQIDPALVIEHLKDCVPTNVELFLPQFTTTTPDSRLALHVAFCDMASPYYDYGTYMCGIPSIRVEGTDDDWGKIIRHLDSMEGLFKGEIADYLTQCGATVEKMILAVHTNDAHYFNQMVKIEPCGSGSQYEMTGWIFDLLLSVKPQTQLEGLPSHLASMAYTNLDTGRTFKLFTGLTESVLDGDFLVPRYGRYVIETTSVIVPQTDTVPA